MDWMKSLLNQYEWDGVNISELNFDYYAKDPFDPKKFVPMNADVRADFRKRAGFDPIRLFQPTSPRYYKYDRASIESSCVTGRTW